MQTRFRPPPLLAFLLILALGHGVALAQLPDWGTIAVPPTAKVRLEQSLCAVESGQTVYAYSCFNRTWTSLTVSLGLPNVTILNDHMIVQDGPFYYGYSPRTGRFAAMLAWSPTAQLVPRVSPQSWFSIVTDGNAIHIYQAVDGVWTTYVFPTQPVVMLGRLCALFRDATTVYGVSAFYGTPVALPASGAYLIGAYANAAVAASVGTAYGFSAYTNTWASMPIAGTPSVKIGDGQSAFVQVDDGASISFFSGHTGKFATIPAPASAVTTLSRAVAIVVDGKNAYGYSGLRGFVDHIGVQSVPTTAMQDFFALVDDGTTVRAFSADTGTFSAPISAKIADITTSAEMAYYQPASAPIPSQVYSQLLNVWTPTPNLKAATTYMTTGSVVLAEPNGGVHGLSMYGTKWISQSTPVLDKVHVGSSRANMFHTIVAQAGTSLWAFNERTRAWRMTTTSSPVTTFQGQNTALITIDGSRAYGFSNWSDRWASTTLNGTVVGSQIQPQSGYVQDATSVHVFAGVGQLSTSHDYPEYWRAATQGSRVRIDLAAEPNSYALLAASLGAASIPVPPHGTLLIDPTRMLVLATPGIPAIGLYGLNFQVPVGLVTGVDLHFQAAVFVGTNLYLTNAITLHLL